jgi:isoaspartyl peptidase/L-asparaginase-like protein (Ntn-hydrolase superfamily)
MGGEIVGECRDGVGVLALGGEDDAGLVDIDEQGGVVVATSGGGFVDRQPGYG